MAATKQQDAIALIKQDHVEVDELFKKFKGLSERATKTKQTTVDKIIEELTVHTLMEEQLLYPVIVEVLPDGKKLEQEAQREHQEVKEELARIQRMEPDSDEFDRAVTQLMKDVKHHVKEEETEMLAEFKKAVDREQLIEMGANMKALKKSLLQQVRAGDTEKIVQAAADGQIRLVEEEELESTT